MKHSSGHSPVLAAIALASFGAVAVALMTQHLGDMQPCPWCVLQRLVFVLIGLVAMVGALSPQALLVSVARGLIALLALGGLAAAIWQHFVAAGSASCNLTLADRIMSAAGLDGWWPEVFAAYASCADAKQSLLGLPYEFYSAGLFAVIAAVVLLRTGPLRHD